MDFVNGKDDIPYIIWVNYIIFHSPEWFGHLGMIPLINHDSSEVAVRSL